MESLVIGKREMKVDQKSFEAVNKVFTETVRHLSKIQDPRIKEQALQEAFVEVMNGFEYKQAQHYLDLICCYFDSMEDVLGKLSFLLDLAHLKIEMD